LTLFHLASNIAVALDYSTHRYLECCYVKNVEDSIAFAYSYSPETMTSPL